MALQLTQVLAKDNDGLEVHGFDDTNPGNELIATGWQSAMSHYYPGDQYGQDGHLLTNAQSRAMTDQEKQAYWLRLLQEVEAITPVVPTVLFENSQAMATLEQAQQSS